MKRGDLVTVAVSGDFGKPRPALVIQSNYFSETATVTVLLISGTLVDALHKPTTSTVAAKWIGETFASHDRQTHDGFT